jgi:S1-C subfamily serine protease
MAEQKLIEQLSNEISSAIESISKSVVLVQGRRFPSSGIVWQENLVITTDHSLPRSEEVQIQIASGEVIQGNIVGRDPSIDVAFLKTTAKLETAPIETNANLKTGQFAIALGRAAGGRLIAVTSMISGSDGEYRNWRGGKFDRFIRLDIAPFPGFSGSALVLANGKIAGLNTSAFSRHFGLTVPASNIERVAQRLSTKGSIGRPYLGIMAQPVRLPEKLKEQAKTEIGLLLMGTETGSPSEAAGLLIGDILVRLNEKTVNSTEEIQNLLTEDSVGKDVKVGVIRGGNLQEVAVKVGERPSRQRNG